MKKRIVFLYVLFAVLFIAGCETETITKYVNVPNEELLDILGVVSFVIAIICTGVTVFSKDDERRLFAGAAGLIFLIVGIILLKACE